MAARTRSPRRPGSAATTAGELILLASSVSREHAELCCTDALWTLRDLGSRNGTYLNREPIHGSAALPGRARIKIGDVALWFLSEVTHEPPQPTVTRTAGSRRGRARYYLERGGVQLCVVISDDVATAGTLLWRPVGCETWDERTLPPLEFQLLRALCIRAHEDSAAISSIRGCMTSKQLVSELLFQSRYANQENVRQVVLRLRGVLSEIGLAGMLVFAPARGYYLSCFVEVVPAG